MSAVHPVIFCNLKERTRLTLKMEINHLIIFIITPFVIRNYIYKKKPTYTCAAENTTPVFQRDSSHDYMSTDLIL